MTDATTYQNYIDGAFVACDNLIEVRNPATGAVLSRVPESDAATAERAIAAARAAQKGWSQKPAVERAGYLRAIASKIRQNAERLARVITEDFQNPNVLFLGTEFGAWVSIDRGNSWTRMNNDDLPTVPVHDFKLHPLTGELIAGTHGRSIWITDVSTLRQLSEESMSESAVLYQPEEAQLQRRGFEAGSSGTRRFVGENPPTGTRIRYSLGNRARSVKLWVTDINGEVVYEFETESQPGLHEVQWDLRRASENNRRWGRPIPAGQYLIQLRVDGVTQHKVLEVLPAD